MDACENRRRRRGSLPKRVLVGIAGGAITVLGIALMPLPGPGTLIVLAGLSILATEFLFARRIRHWVQTKWRALMEGLGARRHRRRQGPDPWLAPPESGSAGVGPRMPSDGGGGQF